MVPRFRKLKRTIMKKNARDVGQRKLAEAAAHLKAQQQSDAAATAAAEKSARNNQTSPIQIAGGRIDAGNPDLHKTKFQSDLRQAPDFFVPAKPSKIAAAVSTTVPQGHDYKRRRKEVMNEQPRRGPWAATPEPKFANAGENSNPGEYKDGKGKSNPAPCTTKPDGTPIYASDGLTREWTGPTGPKARG
jgi:hypothetical protein